MAGEKILIVEDEKPLMKILRYNLEGAGFKAVCAGDGETGLGLLRRERPALVILDIMLPKLDGFEFLKIARKESGVPVLILTARKEEVNRVLGLELGADDYVTKPFSVREVIARVRAILRRGTAESPADGSIRAGELEIFPERHEVRVSGRPAALSPKEFQLLCCLARAAGRVLSREDLLRQAWGIDAAGEIDTNTVDQHVARLRGKLGDAAGRVVTVKGAGYRLRLD